MNKIKIDIVIDYLYDHVINNTLTNVEIRNCYISRDDKFRFMLSPKEYLIVQNGWFYFEFKLVKPMEKEYYHIFYFYNIKKFKNLKKIFNRAKNIKNQDDFYEQNKELISILPKNYIRKQKLNRLLYDDKK